MLLVNMVDWRVYNLFYKLKKEFGNVVDDMFYICKNCFVFNDIYIYMNILIFFKVLM